MPSFRTLAIVAVALASLAVAGPAAADGPRHSPGHGYGPGSGYGYGYGPGSGTGTGHGHGYGYDPGYGYGPGRPRGPATCVAAAFRGYGDGPRIRGTRAVAEARSPERACRRAIRQCYDLLAYAPHGPAARCLVVRAS